MSAQKNKIKNALVLTGGGARAAYQVGALRAIAKITKSQDCPFQIISGISAGSINGLWLAAHAEDFTRATKVMWKNWGSIRMSNVFKVNPSTLLWTGARLIKDLSLGGWIGTSGVASLLDSRPLGSFLNSIDFSAVDRYIKKGILCSVGVTTTNYHSGDSVTFFNSDQSTKPWARHGRFGVRSLLDSKHILASTAIPVFFPAVKINGSFYGDGMVRLKTPLSPAIKLGADKILSIGIHSSRESHLAPPAMNRVTVGDIAETLLNELFLDTLDDDIENLERINRVVSFLSESQQRAVDLKKIKILSIRPSKDLGELAVDQFEKMPFTLRHLLKGLGASDMKSQNMISYLSFDQTYTKLLLRLGYEDAMKMREEILDFFASGMHLDDCLLNQVDNL